MTVAWTYIDGNEKRYEERKNLTMEEATNLMHELMIDENVEQGWHEDEDGNLVFCFSHEDMYS